MVSPLQIMILLLLWPTIIAIIVLLVVRNVAKKDKARREAQQLPICSVCQTTPNLNAKFCDQCGTELVKLS